MAQYVLKELPLTDGEVGEKLFQTPSGNEYRVRLGNGGPTNLIVHVFRNDESRELVSSGNIALMDSNSSQDVQNAIEQQLTSNIREAERQLEAKAQAKNYLLGTWGLDITAGPTPPPPIAPVETVKIDYVTLDSADRKAKSNDGE